MYIDIHTCIPANWVSLKAQYVNSSDLVIQRKMTLVNDPYKSQPTREQSIYAQRVIVQ
jgi:hypothetical protein